MCAVAPCPGYECSLGFVVQGTVFQDDLPDMRRHFGGLSGQVDGRREVVGREGCAADREEGEVVFLSAWKEEEYAEAFATCTTGTATSVKEHFRVGWGVELKDEVYGGNVETAGCNVGCKEQRGIYRGGEVGEVADADFLWLLPVKRDESDGLTRDGGEERAENVLVVIDCRACGYVEYRFLGRWIEGGKDREDGGQLLRGGDCEISHLKAGGCFLLFCAIQTANFYGDLDGIA